jgi:hypothetical protein
MKNDFDPADGRATQTLCSISCDLQEFSGVGHEAGLVPMQEDGSENKATLAPEFGISRASVYNYASAATGASRTKYRLIVPDVAHSRINRECPAAYRLEANTPFVHHTLGQCNVFEPLHIAATEAVESMES